MEPAYGIISYQVQVGWSLPQQWLLTQVPPSLPPLHQDASRNPVTVTVAPAGVRVLRGMMDTNHYAWWDTHTHTHTHTHSLMN